MVAQVAFAAAIEIAVLTMTPGADLFARFGHTAVRVDDNGKTRVFNYGTFNGRDPALVDKFVHNRVDYWLSATTWEPFVKHYDTRDMTGQVLNLTEDEAARVVAKLEWTLRPENRAYRYDWFRNNCSTKVRDLLDDATGGNVKRELGARPGVRTIRGVLQRVLEPIPTVLFAMDIGLNARIDEQVSRFDELAMPGDLMEALREVKRADGSPLVAREWKIAGPGERPWHEPVWFLRGLALGLLGLLLLGRWSARAGGVGIFAWSFLSGLIGVWCVFWSLFLPYPDTHFSASLVSWNPLMWGLLPLSISLMRNRARNTRRALQLVFVVMAATVIELATHLVGLGKQQHFSFTFYALCADTLVIVMLRERERVLGRLDETTAERATELASQTAADVG